MKVISVSTIGNLISAHMKKQYLARIQENSEHTFYQPLSEHLQHVSSLIEVNSNWKGMQSAKKLVALLHDGGKVETRFDNAMQKQKNTGIRCFPDVKHMVDGGLFFRCLIWENAEKIKAYPASHHDGPAMRAIKEQDLYVAAKFLESAIYMHHRLYDMCDLKERLTLHEAYESYMETVWTSDGTSFRQMQENFYNNVIDKEECSTLVVQAVIETIKLYRKCGYFARSQKKQCGSPEFYFGMAERMLISSLMDGDWMDAATCADQRFDQVLANAKACTDWEPLDQAVKPLMTGSHKHPFMD